MRSFLQLAFALLTLAALGWAVVQGYSLLRTEQLGLDAAMQSLVVVAAIILIVCTFILNAAIRAAAHTRAQAALLPRKLELYEGFVLVWHALLEENNSTQEDNLELKLAEIRACLSLQASRPVLQAINELSEVASADGVSAPTTQAAFEKLRLAMRTDLGQSGYVTFKQETRKLVSK